MLYFWKNANHSAQFFMLQKILFLTLITALLLGCTRDDICAETTATTPKLIIVFNDFVNPTERKTVPNLTVRTTDTNQTVVINATATDSIAIPLRTAADFTRYEFIRDDNTINALSEAYRFGYNREELYVNRACAFKTVYSNLDAIEDDEGTNDWILNVQIENQTVENELEAHITIFH